jgi:lipid II:glycine glycyltransferase (peptidoglycan interpeptide bridge formation enzyme)
MNPRQASIAKWEPSDVQPREWNAALAALDGGNFFQTYEWGEYKRRDGWLPLRSVRRDQSGVVVAMVQALTRVYLGKAAAMWIPGGPAGRVAEWADSLRRGLATHQKIWSCYLRLNAVRALDETDVRLLTSAGWRRPRTLLGSRLSVRLTIDPNRDTNLALLSGNWRHNLRRARKADLVVEEWRNPTAVDVARLYAEMEGYKGLNAQHNLRDLESMFAAFDDTLVIYRCLDGNGELLSMRGCGVIGGNAWDLLAATSVQGRKTYASYLVCWEMLERCRELGVRQFDFSGVDPDTNPGVFNFKKGTGAELFSYLGEWETSSPRFLATVVNRSLRRRAPVAPSKTVPSTS